jgi:DNA-binding transcriptional ArsR family regulator
MVLRDRQHASIIAWSFCNEAACTGATQPNVSKHLALLVQAKVVERHREGQRVIYALREPLVMRLCEMVCASLG